MELRQGVSECAATVRSTFAHENDAYPQRGVSRRDARENAIELCKSKAGAAEG
jgi:hypothetical protein